MAPKRCCDREGIPSAWDARVAYEPHYGAHECGNEACFGYAEGYRVKIVKATPTQESA